MEKIINRIKLELLRVITEKNWQKGFSVNSVKKLFADKYKKLK
jgi:hypothetical protein